MSPKLYLRYSLSEFRGSTARVLYFVACLAIGVSAVVVVAGLSAGLDDGIRREAKQLLAADLVIEGRRPPGKDIEAAVDRLEGSRRALVRDLLTVVAARPRDGRPGRTRLVELKVVDGDYPFYGDLELRPPSRLAEILEEERAARRGPTGTLSV